MFVSVVCVKRNCIRPVVFSFVRILLLQDGHTPLMLAAQSGHLSVVEYLVGLSSNTECVNEVSVRRQCIMD